MSTDRFQHMFDVYIHSLWRIRHRMIVLQPQRRLLHDVIIDAAADQPCTPPSVEPTDQPKNRTFVPGAHLSSSPSSTKFEATGPFIPFTESGRTLDHAGSVGLRRVILPTAKTARAPAARPSATTSSLWPGLNFRVAHEAAVLARLTLSAHLLRSLV